MIHDVLFLGSSSFAIPALQVLLDLGVHPILITKPDKPFGRGKKFHSTPVKDWAMKHGLSVWEPETLVANEILQKNSGIKPQLIVSAAYGEKIPLELLRLPDFGAINLHPSLLPQYRGAAPVQRVLMKGEAVTGVTLAYMAEAWDSGDIILQKSRPISPEEDAGILLDALSKEGASLLKEALPLLAEGRVKAIPQDHAQATLAPKIKNEEMWIDWNCSAASIANLIRALSPEPGCRTFFEKRQVKIFRSRLLNGSGTPGLVMRLEQEGPVVATGGGLLLLTLVQPESRKMMTGKDFVNGYRIQVGQLFQSCS